MDHREYLEKAVVEAKKAHNAGQIPVGCVLVNNSGVILASEHNRRNKLHDRTAHAEMLAIRSAIRKFDGELANEWTLYSTLEPCPMCLGTIIMAKIGRVVWASDDRHIQTHKILTSIPFLQTRKLEVVSCPFPDIEKICEELHDTFWVKIGRPDKIQPIG